MDITKIENGKIAIHFQSREIIVKSNSNEYEPILLADCTKYGSYSFFTKQSNSGEVYLKLEGSNDQQNWFNINVNGIEEITLVEGDFLTIEKNSLFKFVRLLVKKNNGFDFKINARLHPFPKRGAVNESEIRPIPLSFLIDNYENSFVDEFGNYITILQPQIDGSYLVDEDDLYIVNENSNSFVI